MATIDVLAFLNLLSGLVALLISYYAYRSNRLVNSILLRYISMGFLLLGVSLLVQAGTERLSDVTVLEAAKVRGVRLLAFIVYSVLELIAYGVFAWGYGLSAFARNKGIQGATPAMTVAAISKTVAYAILVLAVYLSTQAGVVILLILIVIQGIRVFSNSKSNLALIVLFGFILILMGHLLVLAGILGASGSLYLAGNSIEFCGFVSLLFFLFWSSRIVK
jgi:hypothetical protein